MVSDGYQAGVEAQLNIYGWLVNQVKGLNINKLQVCAMIRDWSRTKLLDKFSDSYPKAPIHMLDIPVWSLDKTEQYIRARVKSHKTSKFNSDLGDELPLCTDEERWKRPTRFAVMKDGGKRAIKLFDVKQDADKMVVDKIKTGGKFYVEKRTGEAVRCTGNYCGVAEWCSQYHKEIASNQDGETS